MFVSNFEATKRRLALKQLGVVQVEIFFGPCRNPALAKCEGEAQHSQSWGLGVRRDSRMFRVR
jgi:hypothetical protein